MKPLHFTKEGLQKFLEDKPFLISTEAPFAEDCISLHERVEELQKLVFGMRRCENCINNELRLQENLPFICKECLTAGIQFKNWEFVGFEDE